jgi:hypothetical protein
MVDLPAHTIEEGFKVFSVIDETETIIFKCEATLKEVLKHIAKNDSGYGNTITSVITHFLVNGLENEKQYKFDKKLAATKTGGAIRSGEAIPYAIKSKILSAQERSSIGYYANEISAKLISVEEATAQMNAANAELLGFLAQGYSLDDLHPNKKSFGHKWSEGDWIWEVSQKTDEDEEVMVNGKEITRKKRLETDTHYLQYVDNGIEIIAPNVFSNALYKPYDERDEYFNNQLRKVELQHLVYKENTDEVIQLIDECCPQSKAANLKSYISDRNKIEVIAAHLVKFQRKNERRYRYICLDCYNKADNTYKQIVFMVNRGTNRDTTSKDFYEEFEKTEKTSKKKSQPKYKIEVSD